MMIWKHKSAGVALLIATGVALFGCDAGHRCMSIEPEEQAERELMVLQETLEEYADAHAGCYPTTLGELIAPGPKGFAYLRNVILDDRGDMIDPWGTPYKYLLPSGRRTRACVWSFGEDGIHGGMGDDRDLCSLAIWDGGEWEDWDDR